MACEYRPAAGFTLNLQGSAKKRRQETSPDKKLLLGAPTSAEWDDAASKVCLSVLPSYRSRLQ
jgi:hypothetical protein